VQEGTRGADLHLHDTIDTISDTIDTISAKPARPRRKGSLIDPLLETIFRASRWVLEIDLVHLGILLTLDVELDVITAHRALDSPGRAP
jgi:hypothetical protein